MELLIKSLNMTVFFAQAGFGEACLGVLYSHLFLLRIQWLHKPHVMEKLERD